MHTRKLGNSNLELSVIGLGTWAIGGGDWKFGWGDQDERTAIDCIVRATELGINWIDTAAVYGFGQSETIVGKALKEIPQATRPLIATKCGRTHLGEGQIGKCLQRDSVVAECEQSLRNLDIDCIDLYQMHWPEPDDEIEEGWQTLVDLQAQGKVRHIGVSNHNVDQLKKAAGDQSGDVAATALQHDRARRRGRNLALLRCQRHRCGLLQPHGQGALDRRVHRGSRRVFVGQGSS